MMKNILFLVFFLALSNCFAQEESTSEVLEVKVRLLTDLDSVTLPPYCGTLACRMTFEFEILSVINGTYSEEFIPINILCPRESVESEWLITGKEYTFQLKPRISFVELATEGNGKEVYSGDFEIVSK